MMKNTSQYLRRGAALISVLLITFTLTVVAMFTLLVTRTESQATSAFRYNRQTASASHAVADIMHAHVNSNDGDQIEIIMDTVDVKQKPYIKNTVFFMDHTGLASTKAQAQSSQKVAQLQGDLSHAFVQLGAVTNPKLVDTQSHGFSIDNMMCRYSYDVYAIALAGNGAALREMMDNNQQTKQYFTRAELDSRSSSRKYDFIPDTPLSRPCNHI